MNFRIKIAGALGLAISLFGAGYRIAQWRCDASHERAVEKVDAQYRMQIQSMLARLYEQQAEGEKRERELSEQIEAAHHDEEKLRNEIENRPVIKRVVEKPVNGECPAVPAVDWRVFQRTFDCAADGTHSCAADTSGSSVLRAAKARR